MGKGYIYILLVALLAMHVSAIGISYQYMENNTLNLYPGQEYHFKLVVQNKDLEPATANITEESDLVTIIGDPVLEIPPQNFDTYVVFNISIPSNARIGETHIIKYTVSPVEKGEGQVPLSIRYSRDFKVLIVEAPAADESPEVQLPVKVKTLKDYLYLPLILLIIVVALVGGMVWRKSSQLGRKVAGAASIPEVHPAASHEIPSSIQMTHQDTPSAPEPEPQRVETTILHNTPSLAAKTEEKLQQVLPKIKAFESNVENAVENVESKIENKWNFSLKKEVSKPKLKGIVLSDPSKFFYARNGAALKSLNELTDALATMDDGTYAHHVNASKNDFANWTLYCLQEEDVASNMFKAKSRAEMLKAAKNEA